MIFDNDEIIIRPCKGSQAWIVSPRNSQSALILSDLIEPLKNLDFLIQTETPHVLIVSKEPVRITIYPSSKLLVDGANNESEALTMARQIYNEVGIA